MPNRLRRGAAGARPRMPPLLVLIICGVAAGWAARAWPRGAFALPGHGLLGVLLAAVGLGVAVAGVRAFVQARTTVDPRHPDRDRVLVHQGIYRITRNPMYLGFALILAAWSMWLAHIAGLAALLAFVMYIDTVQIPPEEAALRARFGRAFDAYAARVGRWL